MYTLVSNCCIRWVYGWFKKAISKRDEQIISLPNEGVYSKKYSIRDTIPKNKRINFSNDYVQQAPGGKKEKVNQMKKDGLISIFRLAEKIGLIELVELFRSRAFYQCFSTFNFDDSMWKTQKDKALEKCIMSPTTNCPREYVCLVDMGFI